MTPRRTVLTLDAFGRALAAETIFKYERGQADRLLADPNTDARLRAALERISDPNARRAQREWWDERERPTRRARV